MRCFGLGILNRRWWQPVWLAVVLTPVAALSCYAMAERRAADGQDHHARREAGSPLRDSQKTWEDGGDRLLRLATASQQIGSDGRSSRGGTARIVVKATRPPGKSPCLRRGAERRWTAPLAGLGAISPGATISGDPTPMASGTLFAEHALLRRLEL